MILFVHILLLLLFTMTNTVFCEVETDNRIARGLRIVGGQEASISSAPFVASLQRRKNNLAMHICGAVIVSNTFLLTAAHCITDRKSLIAISIVFILLIKYKSTYYTYFSYKLKMN